MLLVVDSGNTNLVFALYQNDKKCGEWRTASFSRLSRDDIAVWLSSVIANKKYSLEDIKAIIIACVVPTIENELIAFGQKYIPQCLVVGRDKLDFGFKNYAERPDDVGADRLVNGVSGQKLYGCPLIVIDFGTATSFDFFNKDGHFIGGIIAPGIYLSRDALYRAAEKLPRVKVKKINHVIGKATYPAVEAGLYWGYIAMIEGLLSRAIDDAGFINPKTVATGGLAQLFYTAIDSIDYYDKDLTLKGLQELYQRTKA
ncbi:MAG: type III pantothenate kinase [Pseudomonadota bacterium]